MMRAGVLLDAGPLVALLDRTDANHERAKAAVARCMAPFRTCESVLVEAAHLLAKVSLMSPHRMLELGRNGLFVIALRIDHHWSAIEQTLDKYSDVPASLADACLIRCAELHQEPRILTFDTDFRIYRWAGRKHFEILP